MREIGTFKGYSIVHDPLVGGCHICRISLIIKTGPVGLPVLAENCARLVNEQVEINLSVIQSPINTETGEVK